MRSRVKRKEKTYIPSTSLGFNSNIDRTRRVDASLDAYLDRDHNFLQTLCICSENSNYCCKLHSSDFRELDNETDI